MVVGITASLERARHSGWDEDCDLLPRSYALAVQAASAACVLLPADDNLARSPEAILDRIDALILGGGPDVDPLSYGAAAHELTSGTRPERDRFELALSHAAIERGMPLLGVCRGMELLNVACGGTLAQHLPDELGSDMHSRPGIFTEHEVELDEGSLAARAVGATRTTVRSAHHQGVLELGEGLTASGRSASDGVIEAIELPGHRFALGVLWHPEVDEASRVIAALVEAARVTA